MITGPNYLPAIMSPRARCFFIHCTNPVREVRLVEDIHWGVTRGPAKQAVEGDCSRYPHPSSPDRLPMP